MRKSALDVVNKPFFVPPNANTSSYRSTVSAIDPSTGQVIELPIDQAGAYIMQDGSSVLAGAQLQGNIQGGKSLLKPELAQHLNQHPGFKVIFNNDLSDVLILSPSTDVPFE
ncbi:unnamed protein product [Echinostoma caproni]|uniref:Flagellar basal body protein n=1 Tax=Echinostoma caproni TaxID=27848 RepID=A0A183BCH2_9TREM|nr:unnamed protein product [Echinostoma caproni]